MKKLLLLLFGALLAFSLGGCSINQKPGISSEEISNTPEPDMQSHFQEVYRQELPENVLSLGWLNDTRFYWVTESRNTDGVSYELRVADVSKGTESIIFERSLEADHTLDIAVNLSDNQLYLYLRDVSDVPIYSKVILSTADWKIISEEPLNFTQDIFWPQKSKQDIVIGQDIIKDKKGTFNWKIILYPLESPERFYPLKQFSETRYDFPGTIWSPSGEYFILANYDALGMDRFESLSALFGYPKVEWPTALQYDVFKKDGSFAFSFAVDFIYKDDGSESNFDIFWMPGDQIYISSTFYDATLDTKQSKDHVINSSGTVVYEKEYEGDRNYFGGINFVNGGVYYDEKKDDATHMMQLSFPTGEITDYGPIAPSAAWGWVSTYISPDETFVLLKDNQDRTIRVLELIK